MTPGESSEDRGKTCNYDRANPYRPAHESTAPTLPPIATAKDPHYVAVKSVLGRDVQGCYRDKKLDGDIWGVLVTKYKRYRSEEILTQCIHEYNTQ